MIEVVYLRVDLCLADHIWMVKCAAIAERLDDLGDQLCPAMRKGWLADIMKKAVCQGPALSEGEMVVEDDKNS
jgi:hypothetical protein